MLGNRTAILTTALGSIVAISAGCMAAAPTNPPTTPTVRPTPSISSSTTRPSASAPSPTGPAYVRAVFFNVRPGHPFADPALRQAIAMCLDTATMYAQTASIAPEPIIPATGLLSGDATADDLLLPAPRFDREDARTALASAGWTIGRDGVAERDGARLESLLEVIPAGPAWHWQPLVTTESDLRACGVDLAHPEDYTGGLPITTDRAELGLTGWPATPEGLAAALGSAAALDGDLRNVTNWSGWSDTVTDRLLGDLGVATTEADRHVALAALEERISEQLPVIPLWLER